MKLLCAADLHLGRQPSRVPDALAGAELGPAAAWRRTVDVAVARGVQAVLLAGDVVENENDFFEAYADLRQGVERLAEAGIRVLAVSGNHDVRVLPRLAEAVPSFTLLGAGGRWQGEVLEGGDGRRVRVVGWSFPESTAARDPLAEGVPPREGDLVTLGLLHADRDQAQSRYAPVRSADLQAAPVDAWLLGHVHKPDLTGGARPIGYLGSLVGADPGEAGPRGPWLLEVGPDGGIAMEHLPIAPLRWEDVEVDVNGLEHAGDVGVRIAAALEALHERIAVGEPPPRAVGCRLRLTGRSSLRRELQAALDADDPRLAPQHREEVAYFVHDWRIEALPEIDLHGYAQSSDPLGLVARALLAVRGEGDEALRAELIGAARERLGRVPGQRAFRSLGAEPPDDARTAELLERAALRVLDTLLAQREGEAAS